MINPQITNYADARSASRARLGTNFKLQIISFFSLVIFLLFAAFVPFGASAATLYLDPVKATLGPDDTVEVRVKIGVGLGECVNVAQVEISFPIDVLEVKDFNSGESFLSLWEKRPDKDSFAADNKAGKIIFSGGIPGGYCGKIPGDPGDSNILGSIVFTPKKPIAFRKAELNFTPKTELFLNDGKGTNASLQTQGAVLALDGNIKERTDSWAAKISADNIPPQPFTLEIYQHDGKYFVVFSAIDKETGIDHYEILEAKASQLAEQNQNFLTVFWGKIMRLKPEATLIWTKTESPYLLQDQSLQSVIRVKAIDRAGNETLAEYSNAALVKAKVAGLFELRTMAMIAAFLLLLGTASIIMIIRRKTKKEIS